YALLSSGLHDGVEDGTFGGFIVLTDIRSLPRGVLALLRERCPGWRFDQEGPSEPPYLMNHCLRCGGQLADRHLHAGPGSAFYPRGADGCRNVSILTLPVGEEVRLVCGWTSGIDRVLDVGGARPWGALPAAVWRPAPARVSPLGGAQQ